MKNNGPLNRIYRRTALATAAALAFPMASPSAFAAGLPTGGNVVAGSGSISTSGTSMTVTQTSAQMAAEFQTFNIGINNSVNVVQPTAQSNALFRVLGSDVSVIQGRLNANGQLYLINPNGVLFTPTAQVNVGGIVASTLNLSTSDFMAGNYQFSGSSSNAIVNQGNIVAAQGGTIALIAAKITNDGNLTANGGNVLLGAGSTVTLDLGGPVKLRVEQGALDALIANGGAVHASGGLVYLTAKAAGSLTSTVINNTGLVEAQTLATGDKGTIVLLGGMENDRIVVGGTLDASAPHGDGGFIETSAAHVQMADSVHVTTLAAQGHSGTWLIDPVDFTIAASGGDMTGAQMASALAGGNFSVQSSNGASGTAGNINVNDSVDWSANTLTLNAQNNIDIKANLNGSGTARLALQYGQGAVAAGNTSDYILAAGASINLPAGQNFTTQLGSDGAVKAYTVITSLGAAGSTTTTDLQGMSGGLSGNYALGGNIDASATSGWNAGAGFSAIGSFGSQYLGTFTGLGHTISGLTINNTANNQGLFGYAGVGSTLRNVGMVGGSIAAGSNVGRLAGTNAGTITASYATSSVSGTTNLGGLVGSNSGSITSSYATGSVSVPSIINTAVGGGLVGSNGGSITGSYATGSVGILKKGTFQFGGLVGSNSGSITSSYATGSVSGSGSGAKLGGLVGSMGSGSIATSYAAGSVTTTGGTGGGLVGFKFGGTITSSYWNSSVFSAGVGSGSSTGATGLSTAQMQQQSNFVGWDFGNTWVGYDGHTAPLLRSFMTPLTVTVGGSLTYDGQAHSGADVVTYSRATNSNLLGTLTYTGGGTNAGSYALSASGLYSNQQGYIITMVNGTLTINKAHLTVTADNHSRTYGAANPAFTATLSGFVNGENLAASGVTGSGTGTTTATTSAGVGSATISAGVGTLAASNYDFSNLVDGTLTINKATLTYNANASTATVGQTPSGLGGTVSGFVNGEVLANVTTGSLGWTSPATAGSTAGTYAVNGGGLYASNYDFVQAVGNASALTLVAPPTVATNTSSGDSPSRTNAIETAQSRTGSATVVPPLLPVLPTGNPGTPQQTSGGLALVSVPAAAVGAVFAHAGVDPFGFMRVSVVDGGVRVVQAGMTLADDTR